ncbi:MAG TPA: hypothetical protein PLR41_04720 [Alphaproteobacteria bacterium]|nr:hypothetical protein [Alphaproteobacteria bacterium]
MPDSKLKTIRLELARTKEFPEGNARCGYEFVAPLNREGHLDLDLYRREKGACRVHRFWAGEKTEEGTLLHLGHDRWVFSYAPGEDDDEPAFKFDRHFFLPGEYVSITEHDGVTRPFKVVSVK